MKKLTILLLLVSLISACDEETPKNQDNTDNANTNYLNTDGFELPKISESDVIIEYSHFTVSYNEQHELANWVAYELASTELEKNYQRTDNFRPDPNVASGTADDNDYSGSGYDRGHLMPAADCTWDLTAMEESFFYTNIAPQLPGLNRGEWFIMEDGFRELAVFADTLWIVTGPVFGNIIDTIGPNNVSVPGHYFKACVYKVGDTVWESQAYVLPNEAIDNDVSFSEFKMSIDQLEEKLGIDLFTALPDSLEDEIEGVWYESSVLDEALGR